MDRSPGWHGARSAFRGKWRSTADVIRTAYQESEEFRLVGVTKTRGITVTGRGHGMADGDGDVVEFRFNV